MLIKCPIYYQTNLFTLQAFHFIKAIIILYLNPFMVSCFLRQIMMTLLLVIYFIIMFKIINQVNLIIMFIIVKLAILKLAIINQLIRQILVIMLAIIRIILTIINSIIQDQLNSFIISSYYQKYSNQKLDFHSSLNLAKIILDFTHFISNFTNFNSN